MKKGTQRAARTRNGMCQPYSCPSVRPIGTPRTEAIENDIIRIPVAAPRRFSGKTSPMIVIAIPPRIPPKAPVNARAAIRVMKSGATPQARVPSRNPANSTRYVGLRANRSRNSVDISPASPAATVYAATTRAKRSVVRPIARLSCGASGMITMKSTIEVNCTVARTSKIRRSWRVDRLPGSVEGMKNPSRVTFEFERLFPASRRRSKCQGDAVAVTRANGSSWPTLPCNDGNASPINAGNISSS